MRDLTEAEAEMVHNKLLRFIGPNKKEIFDSGNILQLHNQKIFLISETQRRNTSQIGRKDLVCAGTILGKFTKSNNFRISVTAIHLLERFALHRVWVKSSAEMNFLYGNNVLRSHMHKISNDVPKNNVVFVYNQNNTPLGFDVTA